MAISELIKLLQSVREDHGEVEIFIPDAHSQGWKPVSDDYFFYKNEIVFR